MKECIGTEMSGLVPDYGVGAGLRKRGNQVRNSGFRLEQLGMCWGSLVGTTGRFVLGVEFQSKCWTCFLDAYLTFK